MRDDDPSRSSEAIPPRVERGGAIRSTRARVLVLFTCGYFVSYLFRGINIAFQPSIARDLGIGAGTFGLVTAMYFLGFALAQVPAGLLLDRYGPRRVEAALLLVAAAGALVFGGATGIGGLLVGRFLIGAGLSIFLAAAFKALASYFDAAALPALNGVVMAGGGLGGVVSGTPAVALMGVADRWTMSLGLAALTLLTAAALLLAAPDTATRARAPGLAEQLRGTASVLASPFFWRVAPFSVASQGVFYATQSLWAATFMGDVEGFDGARAASFVTLIGVAMMAGSLLAGAAARRLESLGLGTVAFSGLCMAAFVAVQMALVAGVTLPAWLSWSLFGLFGPTGVLTYAVLARAFPAALAGRVATTLTLLLFLAIFLIQWGIGAVVALWPASNGHHPALAHRVAWGMVIALQLLAALPYLDRRLRAA